MEFIDNLNIDTSKVTFISKAGESKEVVFSYEGQFRSIIFDSESKASEFVSSVGSKMESSGCVYFKLDNTTVVRFKDRKPKLGDIVYVVHDDDLDDDDNFLAQYFYEGDDEFWCYGQEFIEALPSDRWTLVIPSKYRY